MKKLSVVIPAYNEGPTIHLILDRVKAVKLIYSIEKEVIIVNDCSKDNTEKVIQSYISLNPDLLITYYKHKINQGKGAHYIPVLQNHRGLYNYSRYRLGV